MSEPPGTSDDRPDPARPAPEPADGAAPPAGDRTPGYETTERRPPPGYPTEPPQPSYYGPPPSGPMPGYTAPPPAPYDQRYGYGQYGGRAGYAPQEYAPSQYGQPQYGQPQYGPPQYAPSQHGQPGPGRPSGAPARVDLHPGPRTLRRPDARFTPALAAAGAGMVVIGLLIWAGGYFAHGVHVHENFETGAVSITGGGRRFLGAGLFTVLALAGYAVTVLRRTGPLATAGTVAGVVGLPTALVFWTLDLGAALHGSLPLNVDVIYLVSIVVWLVSYFAVPGARGRSVYVGAAATALVGYVATKSAGTNLLRAGASATGSGGLAPGGSGLGADAGTIATIGLAFGLIYYGAAALLDRQGRSGAATGLVYAGFVTTVGGLVSAAQPFGQAGTGAALVVIGALLAFYGGRANRRFTTWAWSAAVALGALVLVTKIPQDKYAIIGIVLAVIGIGVAAGAQLLVGVTREPADLDEAAPR